MEILNFIKGLLPSFGKNRLIEDARITRDELKNVVIPSYENADPLINAATFNSDQLQGFDQLYKRNAKVDKKTNFLKATLAGLHNALVFQDKIYDFVEKRFEKDIVVDGITIFKANIVQAQELLSFVSQYSAKLLNYAYVHECAAVDKENYNINDQLSKGDTEYIVDNFLDFIKALNSVGGDPVAAEKSLQTVPDVTIGQNPEIIQATHDRDTLDPLHMRDVRGFNGSPIYRMRIIVAEFQVWRYKYMQDTKRILELRLLNLQKLNDKNPDAKLDKEINYTQSRIDNYAEKMRHFQESIQ